MSDSNSPFPFSTRLSRTNKYDLKREIQIYDSLKSPAETRNIMIEKDLLIKSQRNTIKLYEKKIENLEKNNSLLKQIIGTLSAHITEELNEILPPLPMILDDSIKLTPLSNIKKPSLKGRTQSVDISGILNSITRSNKVNCQSVSTRNYIFDPSMQQNLFQDYHEADFLKAVIDSQLSRDEMQKVVKFLLGKTSQDLFFYKTRTIVFESLSFFLSLRNVAFLNSPEIFLPRTLEMMLDIIEVEKITVFVYDSDTLCSIAVTAEVPKAITIEKNFGHFKYIEEFLIISSAYQDERFDKQYDQVCGFVTRNLACVPMSTESQMIGILECCNKKTEFTGEDLLLMNHVARQLAVAQIGIEIREKLLSLHNKPIISKDQIESCKEALIVPVLNTLALALCELVNCERVNIFLYSPQNQELLSIVAVGSMNKISMPMNTGIPGLAFVSGNLVNADSSHPNFWAGSDKMSGLITREILAVPIKGIGVVECLNNKNFTKFSKTDEKRVETLVETVKVVIESGNKLSSLLYTADVTEFCLQNITQSILHINHQGQLQKLNPAACKLLKIKPEKVIGASVNEIFEHFTEVLEAFWKTVKENLPSQALSIKCKNQKFSLSIFLLSGIEENPSFILIISQA